MILDIRCRWQVQVYVYCALRIPRHLRCTKFSILRKPYGYLLSTVYLFMADSQIQTCLCVVVGPGLVLTSPIFMRSILPLKL